MCDKCQRDCPTCQYRLEHYVREDLYECSNCGHLFIENEVVELLADDETLCLDYYEANEIASTRNSETQENL